ncbi:MAG TPA: DedA family protein [Acidimicrobiales bacterium]|jgi:membrane protein DedA with SNARE-associated domain|nr:DedA family protein [Acidimicrobiales bacterium]
MTHLVHDYGYWAVIIVLTLESFGVPIPGETILIAAGTYAGETHNLSVWIIWALGCLGVLIGSFAGYWVGVRGGYPLLRKYGRYIHMNEPEIKVGLYVFDRYGAIVVSAGRFVAVLRTYAAFLAGTNRMKFPKFAVFNVIGAVAWTGVWSLLSYYVGKSLSSASKSVDYTVGAIAVVLVVAVIVIVRRQAKQLEAVAEAAYPGPLPD